MTTVYVKPPRKSTRVYRCDVHANESRQRIIEGLVEGGPTQKCGHGLFCVVYPGTDFYTTEFALAHPGAVRMPQNGETL